MLVKGGVVEDSGDKEAGECKEEVDANPAGISDETPEAKYWVYSLVAPGEVVEHNREDRDAAESIERGIVPSGSWEMCSAGRVANTGSGNL
jgi:hypothetical protein